jgi:hypothetical protein
MSFNYLQGNLLGFFHECNNNNNNNNNNSYNLGIGCDALATRLHLIHNIFWCEKDLFLLHWESSHIGSTIKANLDTGLTF